MNIVMYTLGYCFLCLYHKLRLKICDKTLTGTGKPDQIT
ncbi:hypothetical protein QSI_2979 [Clostridioides difficile P28]|nr:hypothetical protein QSI_2979 [Clostridioides difficile P28]